MSQIFCVPFLIIYWVSFPNTFSDKNLSVSGNVYCLQLAGERCSKSFAAAGGDREKELKLMLDWASKGFLPTGPAGFVPLGRRKFRSTYLCSYVVF